MAKEKRARIRNVKDSTENWEKANPILLDGEIGFEVRSDGSVAIKIGDGKTAWKLLKYITKTAKEADAGNQYLQDQIDNIVIASSADGGDVSAEVAQARVSIDGTNFATLKDRLDADQNALAIEIDRVETDILSVKEDLHNITKEEINSVDMWVNGVINIEYGHTGNSMYRLITNNYISSVISKIKSDYPYSFGIFAYDENDTYVGAWDGSAFVKADCLYMDSLDLTQFSQYGYQYKMQLRQNADAEITVAEAVNVHFTNDIYDKISINNNNYNQKITSIEGSITTEDLNDVSLWEKGGYSSTGTYKANNVLRVSSYLSDSIGFITAEAGYLICILAYDEADNFVGFWNGTEISETSAWLTKTDLTGTNDYNLRMMIKRTDGADLTVEEAENIHFYNKLTNTLNNLSETVNLIAPKIMGDLNSTSLWERGGIKASGTYKATNRLRTIGYVPTDTKLIYAENNYTFYVIAFDGADNFVGFWNGVSVAETSKALYYFVPTPLSQYKFKVMIRRMDNGDITVEESGNVHFLNDVYAKAFYPTPTLTFIDDDGSKNALDNWESITDEIGIKITAALVTGVMGEGETNPQKASWDDVARLQNKGYEFVSHTHHHINLTEKTEETIVSELEASVSALREHGCESRYLVYPYNAIDTDKMPIVKRYFAACVGLGAETDNTLPIYTHHIRRYSINSDEYLEKEYEGETVSVHGFRTLDELKGYIDTALVNGSWVIIMTHLRNDTAFYHDEASRTMIIDLCKYAVEKGMKIQTFGEAFERYKNVMEIGTIYDSSHYVVDCNGVLHSR